MKTADFDYPLPASLIAQAPLARRDASRLLCVDAPTRRIEHRIFAELPAVLRTRFPHSRGRILLVVNDSKVYPARLRVRRASGARGEVFLLEARAAAGTPFRCLLRPLKKLGAGEILLHDAPGLPQDGAPAVQVASLDPPRALALGAASPAALFHDYGEMPLPPYIGRDPARGQGAAALDRERYQTVYAREEGSAAAPTAGLHFTPEVMAACAHAGIDVVSVTLHVGLGTFQPVTAAAIEDHEMHAERFSVAAPVAELLQARLAARAPVVCVGTTALRTLESFVRLCLDLPADSSPLPPDAPGRLRSSLENGRFAARCAELAGDWHATSLFLRPRTHAERQRPLAADALLTNFHQPCSTLAMLVASLLGYELWREAYAQAAQQGYRFLSYGDSSLLTWEDPA